MSDYTVVNKERLNSDLGKIADAIRAMTGTTESLEFPYEMEDVLKNTHAVYSVTGTLNLENDAVPGTATTSGQYVITNGCPGNAKLFVLTADSTTTNLIKAKTDTRIYTLGVICGFANVEFENITSQNSAKCVTNAWIGYQSKTASGAGTASNVNGISFNSYTLLAGTYYWTAYYWDEPTLYNYENYLASVINMECTELVNSKITRPLQSSFQEGNKNLVKVDLPNITELKNSVFSTCSNLSQVSLPSVTTIGSSNFAGCSMPSLYMRELVTINTGGWGWNFSGNTKLTKVCFPKLTNIMSRDFSGCQKLTTVILGVDDVCVLADVSAFTDTPIASGTGYIYVPYDLVDTYKGDENWKAFVNQILAIPDDITTIWGEPLI